jgi:hypothetical protein
MSLITGTIGISTLDDPRGQFQRGFRIVPGPRKAREGRWPRRPRAQATCAGDSAVARPITVPVVRLGRREPNSVAPAVFAIVERGCMKRPELVDGLRFRAELRLDGGYPPVRLTFMDAVILVEDAPRQQPSTDPPGNSASLRDVQAEGAGTGDGVGAAVDPMRDTEVRMARFEPDVVVEGSLTEIIAIIATPTYRGLPNLVHPHGRSTIATIAAGRVRFRGNLFRARELVRLLHI